MIAYLFGVDEACLHAVRDELHFCHLAREEGGQGLVWTGTDQTPPIDPCYQWELKPTGFSEGGYKLVLTR